MILDVNLNVLQVRKLTTTVLLWKDLDPAVSTLLVNWFKTTSQKDPQVINLKVKKLGCTKNALRQLTTQQTSLNMYSTHVIHASTNNKSWTYNWHQNPKPKGFLSLNGSYLFTEFNFTTVQLTRIDSIEFSLFLTISNRV